MSKGQNDTTPTQHIFDLPIFQSHEEKEKEENSISSLIFPPEFFLVLA